MVGYGFLTRWARLAHGTVERSWMGSGPPVLFCLGTWVQLTETPDTSTDGHGTVKSPTHALLIRSRAGVTCAEAGTVQSTAVARHRRGGGALVALLTALAHCSAFCGVMPSAPAILAPCLAPATACCGVTPSCRAQPHALRGVRRRREGCDSGGVGRSGRGGAERVWSGGGRSGRGAGAGHRGAPPWPPAASSARRRRPPWRR